MELELGGKASTTPYPATGIAQILIPGEITALIAYSGTHTSFLELAKRLVLYWGPVDRVEL